MILYLGIVKCRSRQTYASFPRLITIRSYIKLVFQMGNWHAMIKYWRRGAV